MTETKASTTDLDVILGSERYANNSYFTFPHPETLLTRFAEALGVSDIRRFEAVGAFPTSLVHAANGHSLEEGERLTAYARGYFKTILKSDLGYDYVGMLAWNFLARNPFAIAAGGSQMGVCQNLSFWNAETQLSANLTSNIESLFSFVRGWDIVGEFERDLEIFADLSSSHVSYDQHLKLVGNLLRESFSTSNKFGPQNVLDGARMLTDGRSQYFVAEGERTDLNNIYQAFTFHPSRESKYVDTIIPKVTSFTQTFRELVHV